MPFRSVNPASGEPLRSYPTLDDDGLEAALDRATRAFSSWRRLSYEDRARHLEATADILEAEGRELGRLMAVEMGKPLAQGVAEAEKCAWVCRHYARSGAAFLSERKVETGSARTAVRYEPLGPVLAIMPWNFPFWQVFRFAAPALMAGNVGLLKHATNVPGCALAIEDVLRRAGVPEGVFQNLFIEVERVEKVLADPRIRAATLTGSRRAGGAVASGAGRALKKTVLELGGSDPFIVMPSADLDRAADTAVRARTINSGQSCIAAKRILVHEDVAEPFRERFVTGMTALRVGDPLDERTEVGPLATEDGVRTLEAQVRRTVAAGARITGGGRPDGPGFFYRPAVLEGVPPGSPAYGEELFGPAAALFEVADLDEAVRLANDTPFGLGASVWTTEARESERFLDELDAGLVFVNALVASDPRLPFGGVKESGYGRELGEAGIHEFVSAKTTWVAEPVRGAPG